MSVMLKKPSNATEWSATIIGTLVLAVVGNAIWEWAVKPSLAAAQYAFLNLVSLGLDTYKDRIYYRISAGYHEHPALDAFVSTQMLMVFLFLFFVVEMNIARVSEFTRTVFRCLALGFIFVSLAGVPAAVYVHDALAHYGQLKAALMGPLDEARLRQFDSQLSQVRRRDDFERLVKSMQSEADKHNLIHDNFRVW